MRLGQQGVTLIEACIVVVICAVIAGIAVPSMRDLMDRQSLRGSADELRSDLQFLRSATVSRDQNLAIDVQSGSDGSCYVIHDGDKGACHCDSTGVPICNAGATALKSVGFASTGAVQLKATAPAFGIEPTRGAVTPATTLTLTDRNGNGVSQVVDVLGRIKTCSPGGQVSGYKAC